MYSKNGQFCWIQVAFYQFVGSLVIISDQIHSFPTDAIIHHRRAIKGRPSLVEEAIESIESIINRIRPSRNASQKAFQLDG